YARLCTQSFNSYVTGSFFCCTAAVPPARRLLVVSSTNDISREGTTQSEEEATIHFAAVAVSVPVQRCITEQLSRLKSGTLPNPATGGIGNLATILSSFPLFHHSAHLFSTSLASPTVSVNHKFTIRQLHPARSEKL
uniref:Uncharacterized protein n=1 Tax=Anopheles maculatus TaxID=74869 RepID=A0A182T9W2_9DIPT